NACVLSRDKRWAGRPGPNSGKRQEIRTTRGRRWPTANGAGAPRASLVGGDGGRTDRDGQTRRPERERQHHRHEPDRRRADEEPGVGAEGIVDEPAGPGAEAHSERRDEEYRAIGASHHLLAEVLARDEGVERHHAPV